MPFLRAEILTTEQDLAHVRRFEEEQRRRGGFRRIFPRNEDSDYALFEATRRENTVLRRFLKMPKEQRDVIRFAAGLRPLSATTPTAADSKYAIRTPTGKSKIPRQIFEGIRFEGSSNKNSSRRGFGDGFVGSYRRGGERQVQRRHNSSRLRHVGQMRGASMKKNSPFQSSFKHGRHSRKKQPAQPVKRYSLKSTDLIRNKQQNHGLGIDSSQPPPSFVRSQNPFGNPDSPQKERGNASASPSHRDGLTAFLQHESENPHFF